MSGTVLGLRANTIGGVIAQGAEIASIIPAGTPLILSVEIDPLQIDRVRIGLPAVVRLPNFNSRVTPEFQARVKTVSADVIADPSTGRQYFVSELALDDLALDDTVAAALQRGMPVEAVIQTDARSPASFLTKPMTDYWVHAMREE